MVDIINFGHDEVFTADCLQTMKKRKDKVCSIQFPRMPLVVSAYDQEKEKEHRMEQAWTDKFYKIKARGKYETRCTNLVYNLHVTKITKIWVFFIQGNQSQNIVIL